MKVVLITGGAKRLGQAMAERFAVHGWQVCVHYHHSAGDAANLVARLPQARSYGLDLLAADADFAGLIAQVVADCGRLDCVVNSAALFEEDGFFELSPAAFDRQLAVNFRAPLMLTAAFGQWLRQQDARGSVVNILDQKLFNLNPDYFSYTLSKLALKESIRLQAMAAAPYLRVNGVAPGLTLLSGEQTADNFARAHRMTALGEGTRPQSVAEAVHFLAEAAQITGQVLTVDDGQHLLPLARDVMFAVEA